MYLLFRKAGSKQRELHTWRLKNVTDYRILRALTLEVAEHKIRMKQINYKSKGIQENTNLDSQAQKDEQCIRQRQWTYKRSI